MHTEQTAETRAPASQRTNKPFDGLMSFGSIRVCQMRARVPVCSVPQHTNQRRMDDGGRERVGERASERTRERRRIVFCHLIFASHARNSGAPVSSMHHAQCLHSIAMRFGLFSADTRKFKSNCECTASMAGAKRTHHEHCDQTACSQMFRFRQRFPPSPPPPPPLPRAPQIAFAAQSFYDFWHCVAAFVDSRLLIAPAWCFRATRALLHPLQECVSF